MSGPAFKRTVNLPGQITVGREVTTSVGPQGPKGDTGAQGPQGIPGSAGGARYTHIQSSPVTPWNIPHNLGCHPTVTVQLDVGGGVWEEVDMPVHFVDLNNVQVIPPVPLPGRADLS